MENKPTLKIGRGDIVTLKLESNKPFKEGVNDGQFGKKEWFGYNAVVKTEDQSSSRERGHTYFASKSVHEIIQISQISSDTYFTLELRLDKTKDGNSISVWYLNGKNRFNYQDSGQGVEASVQVETSNNEATTTAPSSINPQPVPDNNPRTSMEQAADAEDPNLSMSGDKKVILKDYVNQVKINLENVNGLLKRIEDEISVPF